MLWQISLFTACQNSTLRAAGSIFHLQRPRGLCLRGGGCWGAAGGLAEPRGSARTSSAVGQYHEALTHGCGNGVQVQRRERSHSQIARIFLNSFIEWRLPFILPPSPAHIAGILSQSHIIIPRSPQATACQWSPRSLDRQPAQSHEKLHAKV